MASIDIRDLERNTKVSRKLQKRLRKINPDAYEFNLGIEIFKITSVMLLVLFSYYAGYLMAPNGIEYRTIEKEVVVEVPKIIEFPLENEKCIRVEAEDGSYMIRCEIKNVEERRNE